MRSSESGGVSKSKPEPDPAKHVDGAAGRNSGDTGVKKKESGVDLPMLAQWLRELDTDGPFTGIRDAGTIAEPVTKERAMSPKSADSSIGYLDPAEKGSSTYVERKVSSPPQTVTTGLYPHEEILACVGSWQ